MGKRTNGEGSYIFIEKRNQWRWTMMFDDINGRPQTKTLYSKNLQKLKARVSEWLQDYRQGKISAGDNVNLKDWVEIWLERVVKPSCKEKTYQNYKTTALNHMLPLFGNLLLKKITAVRLQNYFNELLKSRSAQTVATIRRHFICCLGAAIKFGFLSVNPAKLTAAPRIGPRKTLALTEEQVRSIEKILIAGSYRLPAEDDARLYLQHCYLMIFRLAIQTGMREGEIMALAWSKIDFKGQYLRVDTTLSAARGKLHFDTPKTLNSVRNIYISKTCLNWLQEWRGEQDRFTEKYRGIFDNKYDLVFTNLAGNILSPSNFLHRCFSPVIKKVNIPGATFHTLRHTHASQLLARGVNVQVVAERLGHASVTTTIDVYAHLLPNLQQTAKNVLEEIGNGGVKNELLPAAAEK